MRLVGALYAGATKVGGWFDRYPVVRSWAPTGICCFFGVDNLGRASDRSPWGVSFLLLCFARAMTVTRRANTWYVDFCKRFLCADARAFIWKTHPIRSNQIPLFIMYFQHMFQGRNIRSLHDLEERSVNVQDPQSYMLWKKYP